MGSDEDDEEDELLLLQSIPAVIPTENKIKHEQAANSYKILYHNRILQLKSFAPFPNLLCLIFLKHHHEM
jgi:hypothetical protein